MVEEGIDADRDMSLNVETFALGKPLKASGTRLRTGNLIGPSGSLPLSFDLLQREAVR